MSKTIKRIELGCSGHFALAYECRWRRHTQVGRYRISTVGNHVVSDTIIPLTGDPDSIFETSVFRTTSALAEDSKGCGCREVLDWTALELEHYKTDGEAQRGHEATVKKYMRKR